MKRYVGEAGGRKNELLREQGRPKKKEGGKAAGPGSRKNGRVLYGGEN